MAAGDDVVMDFGTDVPSGTMFGEAMPLNAETFEAVCLAAAIATVSWLVWAAPAGRRRSGGRASRAPGSTKTSSPA